MALWVKVACVLFILANGALFVTYGSRLLRLMRYGSRRWILVRDIGLMIAQSLNVALLVTALVNQNVLLYDFAGPVYLGVTLLVYGSVWLLKRNRYR